MILKASARGGGQNLAVHLMRTDDNEHIDVHEIRGFAAETVRGAFKEAHAISRAAAQAVADTHNLTLAGLIDAPIRGSKGGNLEQLAWLRRER